MLCPNGKGNYYVGEVTGDYEYNQGKVLPHRRSIRWFSKSISREDMSDSLKHSAGSIGTVSNISKYAEEIENLISGNHLVSITTTDETIEDPSLFALEEHLEIF